MFLVLQSSSISSLHHPARDGRKEFLAAGTFQRNGVLGDVLHEGPTPFAFDANVKGRLVWARIEKTLTAMWTVAVTVLQMLWLLVVAAAEAS
jgi:hypothetical protein